MKFKFKLFFSSAFYILFSGFYLCGLFFVCNATETDLDPITCLPKGTILSTIQFPGETLFVLRAGEGLKEFKEEHLTKIGQRLPLNYFPNTKFIQIDLPRFTLNGSTEYYTNSTATFAFDHYDELVKGKIINTPSSPASYLSTYGYLTFPPTGNGRFPCAILCHGSEGAETSYLKYAESLAAHGIASFLVDRFYGSIYQDDQGNSHYFHDVRENQFRLSLQDEIIRTIGAVKLIQSHPNIDPERIGFVGWSRGGSVALECSLKETVKSVYPSFEPKFCVNYYTMPLIQKNELPMAPTLFIHGADDDYTPVSNLVTYLTKITGDFLKFNPGAQTRQEFEIRTKNAPIKMIVYPNAGHAFDFSINPEYLISSSNIASFIEDAFMAARLKWNEFFNDSFEETFPDVMNLSDCCIERLENGEGFKTLKDDQIYSWDHLKKFLNDHKKFGVTLKYNPRAREEALNSTLHFISEVLDLKERSH